MTFKLTHEVDVVGLTYKEVKVASNGDEWYLTGSRSGGWKVTEIFNHDCKYIYRVISLLYRHRKYIYAMLFVCNKIGRLNNLGKVESVVYYNDASAKINCPSDTTSTSWMVKNDYSSYNLPDKTLVVQCEGKTVK